MNPTSLKTQYWLRAVTTAGVGVTPGSLAMHVDRKFKEFRTHLANSKLETQWTDSMTAKADGKSIMRSITCPSKRTVDNFF